MRCVTNAIFPQDVIVLPLAGKQPSKTHKNSLQFVPPNGEHSHYLFVFVCEPLRHPVSDATESDPQRIKGIPEHVLLNSFPCPFSHLLVWVILLSALLSLSVSPSVVLLGHIFALSPSFPLSSLSSLFVFSVLSPLSLVLLLCFYLSKIHPSSHFLSGPHLVPLCPALYCSHPFLCSSLLLAEGGLVARRYTWEVHLGYSCAAAIGVHA